MHSNGCYFKEGFKSLLQSLNVRRHNPADSLLHFVILLRVFRAAGTTDLLRKLMRFQVCWRLREFPNRSSLKLNLLLLIRLDSFHLLSGFLHIYNTTLLIRLALVIRQLADTAHLTRIEYDSICMEFTLLFIPFIP